MQLHKLMFLHALVCVIWLFEAGPQRKEDEGARRPW